MMKNDEPFLRCDCGREKDFITKKKSDRERPDKNKTHQDDRKQKLEDETMRRTIRDWHDWYVLTLRPIVYRGGKFRGVLAVGK